MLISSPKTLLLTPSQFKTLKRIGDTKLFVTSIARFVLLFILIDFFGEKKLIFKGNPPVHFLIEGKVWSLWCDLIFLKRVSRDPPLDRQEEPNVAKEKSSIFL